jgi:hypothetical protein
VQLLEVKDIRSRLIGFKFRENGFEAFAGTEGLQVGLGDARLILLVLGKFLQISVPKRHKQLYY